METQSLKLFFMFIELLYSNENDGNTQSERHHHDPVYIRHIAGRRSPLIVRGRNAVNLRYLFA